MSEYVHIVSLTAPSPPDYGGAFDLFYKIPALARLGKKVILHYFDYKEGRGHKGLEPYCIEINQYKRTAFLRSLLKLEPYIVSSRIDGKLIDRLKGDNHPVLLEGIHCAGLLPYIEKRKILIRVHNDEARYYQQLRHNESNRLKALYFLYEATLLSRFQKQLPKEPYYLFVASTDKESFKSRFSQPNQIFLPCFVPWQKVTSLSGGGKYCLYHGNLSISENINAALWLAKSVFPSTNTPLIIAGKNANYLKGRFPANLNVILVNNPTDHELSGLIKNAHINVLPSLNSTGVKLKLIHALFEGRFCFSNQAGVSGSGMDGAVTLLETTSDWIEAIKAVMKSEFTDVMVRERESYLSIYDNECNARKLMELL
ncbi:MAG: hypothetical protein ACXVBX_02840 [Flavisolibacter sp.]